MTNELFQKCVKSYINRLVFEPSFNEQLQRQELSELTGLTGASLDNLYKSIGEAIHRPERTNSTRI